MVNGGSKEDALRQKIGIDEANASAAGKNVTVAPPPSLHELENILGS